MVNINYGQIIRRSWQITWKNKWLWVMGLVLAVFGGGGSTPNLPKNFPKEVPKELPKETSQVLGAATDFFKTWFGQIPPSTWLLFVLGIILLILFWVIVGWIIKSWAKAALIFGLKDADEEKEVTLLTVSPFGIAAIKNLIIFSLISFFITFGILLGMIFLVGFGYLIFSFSDFLKNFWLILSLIVGILTFIILLILFAMLNIYAERLIVLKNYSPWQAWKKGFGLGRHHFLPTLVMGIINSALGCTVGFLVTLLLLVILAIPGLVILIPLFKDGFHLPGLPQILGILFLIFVFFYANILLRAIMVVFNYGNWNLFFKEIISQEESI